MNSEPDPVDFLCKSLEVDRQPRRVTLPDEADHPVSGEWIRAQMNDMVEAVLNGELLAAMDGNPSLAIHRNEMVKRIQPRGGLLGDDRLYQAVQSWRHDALVELWDLIRLKSHRPIHKSLVNIQARLAEINQLTPTSTWLKKVVKFHGEDDVTWILAAKSPYVPFLDPSLSDEEKRHLTSSLRTWLVINICDKGHSWGKKLKEAFPSEAMNSAAKLEQLYHRAYLASMLYELAWPERGDPPATQSDLECLLKSDMLKGEIIHSEFGQPADETWMQIIDYAVVDLPTGRLVRVLRPGLRVDGRVLRKAQVVISR